VFQAGLLSFECFSGFTVKPGNSGEAVVGVGVWALATIPPLPAAQTTTGVFNPNRLGAAPGPLKYLRGDSTWQPVKGLAIAGANHISLVGTSTDILTPVFDTGLQDHMLACIMLRNVDLVNTVDFEITVSNAFGDFSTFTVLLAAGQTYQINDALSFGGVSPPFERIDVSAKSFAPLTPANFAVEGLWVS
jgi:hypothetical protein